ncbi:putative 2,4-dienoyl-CoA reductase [Pseudomonas sp. 9AZ]|uniref:SDR family oxidoreductase n=1 Tax=Pseudomonas sp. 9AZ TaxID=2653168 RepID=UPI0012F26898|nr:SDR family oxidoreductase [Pseudomonas sp. 9AZ]VXD04374.1 putative 2,4-dienoyl-CoA reductase [Pseudomonas sp. 9AZ]
MTGKTVFISGGTSGINLGIAKGFAAQGDKVLVFGRDAVKAEAAAQEIRDETGGVAMAGSADVRDMEAIRTLFAQASETLGAPTVVIAGAAGNFMSPAVGISANGFKTVIDIDLLGTYNVFRAAYDFIVKPGASLIAITAPQAVQPLPQQVHVCAAKAGVNMVVKVLAMEWGQAGIRVNAISPGPILGTEGVERMAPTEEDKLKWSAHTALRRFGTASDIAQAAIFLSSAQGTYITGTILDCDGGMKLGDASGDYLTLPKR